MNQGNTRQAMSLFMHIGSSQTNEYALALKRRNICLGWTPMEPRKVSRDQMANIISPNLLQDANSWLVLYNARDPLSYLVIPFPDLTLDAVETERVTHVARNVLDAAVSHYYQGQNAEQWTVGHGYLELALKSVPNQPVVTPVSGRPSTSQVRPYRFQAIKLTEPLIELLNEPPAFAAEVSSNWNEFISASVFGTEKRAHAHI